MLVDDNSADNLFHRLVIEEAADRVNVVELTNGPAAIEYLRRAKTLATSPDLLLLDLNMPGMNGWEFLDFCRGELLGAHPDMKVFVLSTTADPDDEAQAELDPAVDGFIAKPLNEVVVERLVADLRR